MTVRFIEPRRDDPRVTENRRYKMVINGKSVDAASGKTIKRESSVHPGLFVGEWPEASREDVETAILAARQAFDEGPWPRMSGKERASYMFALSAKIKEHVEELALIESLEVGKTLAGARGEMNHSADLWHFAAGLVRALEGTTHNEIGGNALGLVLREPIGVVGIITPWNYPLVIGSERMPWAIGAGCTVVIKPSEFTSGSTIRFGELAREAGLPDGVINVVTGYGNPAGQVLAEHPLTDMIAFTGSQRVGRQIGAFAAPTIKRVGLELGGKGPGGVCRCRSRRGRRPGVEQHFRQSGADLHRRQPADRRKVSREGIRRPADKNRCKGLGGRSAQCRHQCGRLDQQDAA